jgi:RNA polymerase sigma-70 factor (ECF subfamily)
MLLNLVVARMSRAQKNPAAAPPPLMLEAVYRDHFEFVYRKAARLGGPGFDAEDATQEVFLIVARKLHTYDGSSLVTTWLYGITFNIVRAMRRRQRLRRFFERAVDDVPDAPVRSLDRVELLQAHRIAYEILDKIAPKKREAFILAELEGLSCEEIAKLSGTRTETVWSRLHYARQEFAKRLEARNRRAPKTEQQA